MHADVPGEGDEDQLMLVDVIDRKTPEKKLAVAAMVDVLQTAMQSCGAAAATSCKYLAATCAKKMQYMRIKYRAAKKFLRGCAGWRLWKQVKKMG